MKKLVVAVYVRVSSDEQVKGYSLDNQEEAIGKYFAQEYPDKNYELRLYRDEGYSGAIFERPAFQKLLVDIELGRVDILACWKLDRLYRDKFIAHDLEVKLRSKKVAFVSTTEPNISLVSDNPETELQTGIVTLFASYERAKTRARSMAGKIKAMQMGIWNGDPPFGLIKENKKLKIDPSLSVWAKKIFEWYAEEELGYNKIAQRLNEYGIPGHRSDTFKRHVNWSGSSVRTILKNSIYTGETYLRKKHSPEDQIKYSCDPIISREFFETVQEKIKRHEKEFRRTSKYPFMFSRFLRCKRCGRKFVGSVRNRADGSIKVSYNTRGAKCIDETSCGSVGESLLNKYIFQSMIPLCIEPSISLKFLDNNNQNIADKIQDNIKLEEESMGGVNKKLEIAENALLEGVITKDRFSERKTELESFIKIHKEKLNLLKHRLISEEERRRLEEKLIEYSLSTKKAQGEEFLLNLLYFTFNLLDGLYIDCKKKEIDIQLKIPELNYKLDLTKPFWTTKEIWEAAQDSPIITRALDEIYIAYQMTSQRFVLRDDQISKHNTSQAKVPLSLVFGGKADKTRKSDQIRISPRSRKGRLRTSQELQSVDSNYLSYVFTVNYGGK